MRNVLPVRQALVLVTAVATLAAGTASASATPAPASGATAGQGRTGGSDTPRVLVVHLARPAGAAAPALSRAIAAGGATVRHVFRDQHTLTLSVPATDAAGARARLAAVPGVTGVNRPVRRTFAALPDDPRLRSQRGYLGAVHAFAAWNRQRGDAGVRIAVVDSGVDVTDPDLAGKVVGTHNAVTGGTAVTDRVGHGTFVAGVAAAATDNGVGIAGAGYNTSLLAVKVDDRYGGIAIDSEAMGIRWAANHGANVINLSFGGPEPSPIERAAVRYAQQRGVLVVAAAGNDSSTQRQYPAAYPGVVAVGATNTRAHRRAGFSNHGNWVTLAAPGVGIVSTVPPRGSTYFPAGSGYATADGTSFATPLVAAAAALVKAQDPGLSGAGLRRALVASAHGYRGAGLGAGQVDYDLALQHTPPTAPPEAARLLGSQGDVPVTARSSAGWVEFGLDDNPRSAPVAVHAGTAATTLSTYGLQNGLHTLHAYSCTRFGECDPHPASTPFTLYNSAPVLETPPDRGVVSGPFVATASAPGGALRLYIDGRPAGLARSAPYRFTVNAGNWSAAVHQLYVRNCTSDLRHCAGPPSAAAQVVFNSLHPRILGLSRHRFSPDGNGRDDTTTLTFALSVAQQASLVVRDAGGTVRRRIRLGRLGAGRHRVVWPGRQADGHPLPDGHYRLQLVTSRSDLGVTRHGLVSRSVVIDTTAPRLSAVAGRRATVFPVHDGYRDAFRPAVTVHEPGRVRLTISTPGGRVIRSLTTHRLRSGRVHLAWYGRTAARRLAPPGTYRWRFTVTDSVGNTRSTPRYVVFVSGKRLRRRVTTLLRSAGSSPDVEHTARCAGRAPSSYRHGLRLTNRCSPNSGNVSYARYRFVLPRAYAHRRVALGVYGRAARTSQLSAYFQRTDGGLELPGFVRIAGGHSGWTPLASVGSRGHLFRGRAVWVTVLLTGAYPGPNSVDLRTVRLRIVDTVLRD